MVIRTVLHFFYCPCIEEKKHSLRNNNVIDCISIWYVSLINQNKAEKRNLHTILLENFSQKVVRNGGIDVECHQFALDSLWRRTCRMQCFSRNKSRNIMRWKSRCYGGWVPWKLESSIKGVTGKNWIYSRVEFGGKWIKFIYMGRGSRGSLIDCFHSFLGRRHWYN